MAHEEAEPSFSHTPASAIPEGKVGDAQVRVVGSTVGVMTRTDGTYRLVIAPGRYELRVSRIGYAAGRDSVIVDAAVTVTKDFRLDQTGLSLDQIVVVGSRRPDRTAVEAPVPIDVLSAEDLQNTGLTETSQIIQMLAPSFNFPRPSVNDGTDHVRPATLRGLGPDQVLVLVNGKRRHTSALVHVNGSIGRGSTGVDLNALPASAIENIEILRDGAAAQYGSDAIAGVINIITKKGRAGGTTYGFQVQGGSVYAGAPGYDDRSWKPEALWMPRTSFGYRLGEKMAVKGGYGMYYDTLNARDWTPDLQGFNVTTTNPLSNDFGLTFALGDPRRGILPIADPFPERAAIGSRL